MLLLMNANDLLMFSIRIDDLYIYIYYFWFVNSPLLLELPPCGQVQVMKTSDMLALVSRALIRNRDGEPLSFLAFLYVSFPWRTCCWIFNYWM